MKRISLFFTLISIFTLTITACQGAPTAVAPLEQEDLQTLVAGTLTAAAVEMGQTMTAGVTITARGGPLSLTRVTLRGRLSCRPPEPLPPDHPLVQLDNVTIVPHIAGSTLDAFLGSPKLLAGHLRRMLLGQGPLPVVNGVQPQLRAAATP